MPADKPYVASMGVYVFSRDVLLDMLAGGSAKDFGREIIPSALDKYRVQSFLFRNYWADIGTIHELLRRQHHADEGPRAVQVLRSATGRFSRTRASCRASRFTDCTVRRRASSPTAAPSALPRSRNR